MITLLGQPVKVVIDIDVVVASRTVGILLMGDILVYFVADNFEIDMCRLGGRGQYVGEHRRNTQRALLPPMSIMRDNSREYWPWDCPP